MQATAAKNSENGSLNPGRASIGIEGTTGTVVSEQDKKKVCPHRYCGCISQNGYMCTQPGPCDPCDERGHRFRMVMVRTADGSVIWGWDFNTPKQPAPVIDSEFMNNALLATKDPRAALQKIRALSLEAKQMIRNGKTTEAFCTLNKIASYTGVVA